MNAALSSVGMHGTDHVFCWHAARILYRNDQIQCASYHRSNILCHPWTTNHRVGSRLTPACSAWYVCRAPTFHSPSTYPPQVLAVHQKSLLSHPWMWVGGWRTWYRIVLALTCTHTRTDPLSRPPPLAYCPCGFCCCCGCDCGAIAGLGLCSYTELSFDRIGFLAAVATNCVDCIQNVYSKKLMSESAYSATQLQFYATTAALLVSFDPHAHMDAHARTRCLCRVPCVH